MKKVITYGTFDLLHRGHINILRRAKELWDHLTVAISSDEFNTLKNKTSFYSYEERKFMLEAIKYVDEVIPENDWEQKVRDVQEREIDIFVMGDDWEWKFDFLSEYCEVKYLPRTEGISTTQLKSTLKGINNENIEKIEEVLDALKEFKKILP
jgi:glycerol-3-phosphate cytidylyltransferase